jgi:hypothetical protein
MNQSLMNVAVIALVWLRYEFPLDLISNVILYNFRALPSRPIAPTLRQNSISLIYLSDVKAAQVKTVLSNAKLGNKPR